MSTNRSVVLLWGDYIRGGSTGLSHIPACHVDHILGCKTLYGNIFGLSFQDDMVNIS